MLVAESLAETDRFTDGARLWSWENDASNMLVIRRSVEVIGPLPPVQRFGNACTLMLKRGMPYVDIRQTASDHLARYLGLDRSGCRDHAALDDALSVVAALQPRLRGRALVAKALC